MCKNKNFFACSFVGFVGSEYSNVLKNMLVNKKHPHPLIFAGGIGHEVLEALLGFIYSGEAKLQNEHTNSFIQLSKNIELVGATSKDV